MKGTTYNPSTAHSTVEWVTITDPDNASMSYTFNVTFLGSTWGCMFGNGCPGLTKKTEDLLVPDLGCCTDGFYVRDEDDLAQIDAAASQLTEEDWDKDLAAHVRKTAVKIDGNDKGTLINGWARQVGNDPDLIKSRVFKGGCVFANRNGGSAGKPGCAFVHMAARLKKTSTAEVDHALVMPVVCHFLPLKFDLFERPGGGSETVVTAWDASRWYEAAPDPEETSDGPFEWWCVDTADAYLTETTPLYKRMAETITREVGSKVYKILAARIEKMSWQGTLSLPGGQTANRGKKMLPLFVKDRQVKRP
jgi:hypothetical protein